MREIKFRCWDTENKEMLDVQELDYQDSYNGQPMIRTTRYNDYFDTKDMILMQYTGLKDITGKEIYEGDIVEYADTYKYIVCFGEYNINPKNCAEAITIGFYLKSIKSKMTPTEEIEYLYSIDGIGARFPKHCAVDDTIKESVDALKLKVIGKIYNNPELLRKGKYRMNNKTADEMFKELGYKSKENQLGQIQYINKNDTVIEFDLDYKTVAVYNYYDVFEYIEMQELQAINKKCEELGWI